MPSAATQSPGGAPNRGAAPRPSVPFVRASAQHVEAPFFDQTLTHTAAQQDLGVIEVPAYGYVRSIGVYVTVTTAANAAAVTFNADAPFNVLQNIQFNEPNGAQIGQWNDGYELYLANKWSGYAGPGLSNDPRANPLYTTLGGAVATGGSFAFYLRIPVELDLRSALGSLPNQAANATFRVRLAVAPLATVYGVSPTTGGQVRIRMIAETWDQPEVASGGIVNQTVPPAVNTTQFWSRQVYNLGAGANQTIRLTRVGNYIRSMVFILRTSGSRAGVNAGNLWAGSGGNVTFYLDSRPIQVINDDLWRHRMWERSGGYGGSIQATTATGVTATPNAVETAYGQDDGVRVLDFCSDFDGNYGRENRDQWQPTLGSTRLEIQSNFGSLTSGTLTVLTNDVALAGNVFM